jgi:hypothetical protein
VYPRIKISEAASVGKKIKVIRYKEFIKYVKEKSVNI